MKFILPLLLLLSQFAFAGLNPVLQNQFTTNAAGTTLGLITATNFTSTAVGQTNVFDVTLFTNGVTSYTSYMPTNTAPFMDNANPTNAFLAATIYTNGNQRVLLVGSAVLIPSANDQAGITLYYTNNGVGFVLPSLCPKAAQAQPLTVPFMIPLSPNATFVFTKVNTGTANSYITNTVAWRE